MNLYGIWIDHSQAIIVKADPAGEMTLHTIASDVEPKYNIGSMEGEHSTIYNQQKGANRHNNQVYAFVEQVVEALRDADEIIVFGPANAKFELKKAIEEYKPLTKKLISVETTDKMTENQLKAHVKEAFRLPRI